MLATLNSLPATPEEFATWSFSHSSHHRDIIRVIYQTTSQRLDEYVLDPFNIDDMGNWPYLHQVMHQQFNAVLGLAGFDLSEVDWRDDDLIRSWINQHANEHYRAGAILGLG